MGAVEAVGHLGDATGVRHVDGARHLDESLLQMDVCKNEDERYFNSPESNIVSTGWLNTHTWVEEVLTGPKLVTVKSDSCVAAWGL